MSAVQPQKQPVNQADNHAGATTSLLWSMADTTWRMVIPSAIFVLLGIIADRNWHTLPWLTLAGVAAGLAVSAQLIKRQLAGADA